MDLDQFEIKKHLYVRRTIKAIEKIIYDLTNRRKNNDEIEFDIYSRLQQLESSSLIYNFGELVHITNTLKVMIKDDGGKVFLPKYMERAFLHLLEEMLFIIQNPTQIQHRLPKIKDEKVLQLAKEYNNSHSRKILIIDNDLLFLNKAASYFSETGFTVLKANRGFQAIQLITEATPECIICGLNLIDIQTDKFLNEIQEKINTLFVPIIAIGDLKQENLIDTIKYNVSDTMIKPIAIDELMVKVMRLLDHSIRMKNQVHIDELTGIFSRKYIMEKLEYFYSNIQESHYSHSLAIVDLDYFKDVNDKYGHANGDKVLIEFSNFIKSKIRGTDIFARYGGEEFILFFPRTVTAHAWKKLNELRKQFYRHKINIGDYDIHQTFSAGIASNGDEFTNNPVEILNLADIALYAAKNSGRNRVLVYEPKMKLKKEQYKILIVDDDRLTRSILLDGLNDEHWVLLEATNGRAAIEIAGKEIPDLILLDGLMPEMNGYEALKEIRKNIRFKQTAIIMLTGIHSEENVANALKSGADDYITKPFSLVELKARINRLLVRNK